MGPSSPRSRIMNQDHSKPLRTKPSTHPSPPVAKLVPSKRSAPNLFAYEDKKPAKKKKKPIREAKEGGDSQSNHVCLEGAEEVEDLDDAMEVEEESEDELDKFAKDPNLRKLALQTRLVPLSFMSLTSRVFKMLRKGHWFAREPDSTVINNRSEMWTHNIMSGEQGGGFQLPPEEEYKFLTAYAADLRIGEVHYMIERRTKFFRFHTDLDIKRKQELDDQTIITLIQELIVAVRKFYPADTAISRYDCVVCISRIVGKTGVHVIFPNLVVTDTQALDIRNYYVSMLIDKYGDMVGLQNSWEDVVDQSVYEKNGLRMVGSHKAGPCPVCSGKAKKKRKTNSDDGAAYENIHREACETCMGKSRVDLGRTYMPQFYFRDGTPHEALSQIVRKGLTQILEEKDGKGRRVIDICSIRCPLITKPSTGFGIHDPDMIARINTTSSGASSRKSTATTPPTATDESELRYRQLKTSVGNFSVPEEDAKGMAKFRQKNYVSNRSEEHTKMQEFIQSKAFPAHWRSLHIANMFCNNKRTHWIINVKGEGRHHCMNTISGQHTSNHIYFMIDRQGDKTSIRQKCYSQGKDPNARRNGLCSEFTSAPIIIPNTIAKLLFPDMATAKVGNFHVERSNALDLDDLDETSERLARLIASFEERRNEYLEKRSKRVRQRKEDSTKSTSGEVVDLQTRKRPRPNKK